jgi:hypothetical protein
LCKWFFSFGFLVVITPRVSASKLNEQGGGLRALARAPRR